jgi:hypothetical protein
MKFAKYVFLIAGIYGLLVVPPLYFLEEKIGRESPPAITHPEYFYGFAGVTLAWQFVFFIISRDPLKYRALMLPSILEKAVWFVPAVVLFLQNRVPASTLFVGTIDLVLGVLFAVSYFNTGKQNSEF